MRELALFAGGGGGILGGLMLGWRTVCAVEIDPYARGRLLDRQREGSIHRFPIWDDVRTFDGRPWNGRVDVVSGGFPCTDISNSGHKAGIHGSKSGLWKEMARIIDEVRPRFVFVENVAALLDRGMGDVLRALAEMGFDARWGVLGSGDTWGSQPRSRTWIVADAKGFGRSAIFKESGLFQAAQKHCARLAGNRCSKHATDAYGFLRTVKPGLDRVADGVANRVDRIRVAGNGQDPFTAATAWRILSESI